LARQPVSLPGLLEETALQANKLLGGKEIAVQLGPAQGIVWADPDRLRQVLLILLENAIRYTPDGGLIRLEACPRHKYCQVIVSDNGAGISPEHMPHIFDRFYQANPTGEGSARSNGLGLSIARGIILASGGRIHLESQLGQGTRVILELPGVE
jgi:signal transduction histidine kinase